MEASLKVSVGSVVLWQHLDIEISFTVSMGSVAMLVYGHGHILEGVPGICRSVAAA